MINKKNILKEFQEKIILHIDLDAFFASCEEVKNPFLKEKAVVIGSDPKKELGRGVVSTCNYKARKFGIKSGMPISWAYKKCKTAEFLKVDMKYYLEVSQKIFLIISCECNNCHNCSIEKASVDEAYIDVSEISKMDYRKAEVFARKLKEKIFLQTKISSSIGIGPNKLIAKIASDYRKPDGLTVVKPMEVQNFIKDLSVKRIPGIGKVTYPKLEKLGIKTIKELQDSDYKKLVKNFGENFSKEIKSKSYGLGSILFQDKEQIKSCGNETTFDKDCSNKELIYQVIEKLCEKSYKRLIQKKLRFRIVCVKIRYSDFETKTKQRKYKHALSLPEAKNISKYLIKIFLRDSRKVRLVGVSFGDIF